MPELIAYLTLHTMRGECQCGKCIDKGPDRAAPEHSMDVFFFWVTAINDPKAEDFSRLIVDHYPELDRLREGPSYIEIGGALGDQGLALRFIGLGGILGLWSVITPQTIGITGDDAKELAGNGFVMCGGFKGATRLIERQTGDAARIRNGS